MNGRLAMGIALLVVGLLVAMWGYNDMNSLGNEVADTLNIEENNGQLILVGGVALALIGLIMAATRGGRSRTIV